MRRAWIISKTLCALALLSGAVLIPGLISGDSQTGPLDIRIRGSLVCLLEETQRLFGVQVPPVHEHLTGIRAEDGSLYTLLRTSTSAFLFIDSRFRGRTLVLAGRTFPHTALLEVTRADWLKAGLKEGQDEVYEVYYWCEVCSIKGMDPGACACCQAPVELRERPVGGGPESRVPDTEKDKASRKGEGDEQGS